MNIPLYIILALGLLNVVQFFYSRYLSGKVDKANASLIAVEVLGKTQNKIAKTSDKKSRKIKETVDEEFKEKLNRINSTPVDELSNIVTVNGVVSRPSSQRECARSLARALREIAILNAKLDTIKKWYHLNK